MVPGLEAPPKVSSYNVCAETSVAVPRTAIVAEIIPFICFMRFAY
jgi:hypothetical protein